MNTPIIPKTLEVDAPVLLLLNTLHLTYPQGLKYTIIKYLIPPVSSPLRINCDVYIKYPTDPAYAAYMTLRDLNRYTRRISKLIDSTPDAHVLFSDSSHTRVSVITADVQKALDDKGKKVGIFNQKEHHVYITIWNPEGYLEAALDTWKRLEGS
jgi:hypothetical protein